MSLLIAKAFFLLLRFDWYLERGDFERLYTKVRECRVARRSSRFSLDQLCRALDVAAIWYPKQVLCLQRSAATVCLLRAHGVSAQLVLGAQRLPFKAHAWVEIDGLVVGDRSYVPELYAVLDRC